jgi:very-short-patch-repair endonuclease
MDNVYEFLSTLEKKVFNWLSKREIPFTTQEPMFGIAGEAGSATVDFIIGERHLALRVMGSYWHSGLEAEARDLFGKEQLINDGYTVVDLREEDLTDDKITHTLELALEGVETIR